MNRSRKFDLAFDVDHAVLSGIDHGGDAGRAAECMIAEADDRQAVDLPDYGAGGINHDGAFIIKLLHPLFYTVDTIEAFFRGGTNIFTADDGTLGFRSPETDFTDKVGDLHKLGRELGLVVSHPCGMLQQGGNAGLVKRQQSFGTAMTGDKQGIIAHDLRGPGNTAVEFRFYLEKLAIIGVKMKQQVVNPGGTDQHDFGPHLNRLRLE